MSCEDYLVMNGILFRKTYEKENGGKPSLALCVPEKYIPTILLYQYHSPLLAGHPGTVKLYENFEKKILFSSNVYCSETICFKLFGMSEYEA